MDSNVLKYLMDSGDTFSLESPLVNPGREYKFEDGKLLVKLHADSSFTPTIIHFNAFLGTKIVLKPWRPKIGDTYYFWSKFKDDELFVVCDTFSGTMLDHMNLRFANVFKTEELANADKDVLITLSYMIAEQSKC